MADDSYRFWCLVEGDTAIFSVFASPNMLIDDLKDRIKEKALLKDVAAKDLTLWMVRMTIASEAQLTLLQVTRPFPFSNKNERMDCTSNSGSNSVELDEADEISDH